MPSVIAQETTTLPEGATVSVISCTQQRATGGLNYYTELRACKGNDIVKMHVDPVSVHSLRQYLDLWISEIQRQRERFTAKPIMLIKCPKNVTDFVNNMAFYGMFIFETLLNGEVKDENKPKKKKAKKV